MVKLVKQSIPFWDELQALTPVQLMDKVGTLWFGDPSVHSTEGNIGEAEKALKAEGVHYTILDAKGLESEYHFRDLPSTYTGLFQKDGASIDLKATIHTLLDWNLASPLVTLHNESPATAINWRDRSVPRANAFGHLRWQEAGADTGAVCQWGIRDVWLPCRGNLLEHGFGLLQEDQTRYPIPHLVCLPECGG